MRGFVKKDLGKDCKDFNDSGCTQGCCRASKKCKWENDMEPINKEFGAGYCSGQSIELVTIPEPDMSLATNSDGSSWVDELPWPDRTPWLDRVIGWIGA